MEELPVEVQNKIKYMTLEHPCAKIIKKAFADYEIYWKSFIENCREDEHELVLDARHSFCIFMFINWQKMMEKHGIDVLATCTRRLSLRGLMNAVYSYIHLQANRDSIAKARVVVYL